MTDDKLNDTSSTEETVEQNHTRLHEKMDKTARSRFIAARQYELHEHLSLYTVVLISCCVIGLTLFDGLGMLEAGAEKLSAFLQVFCAVGVLVYSVILSKSDFALHAYRHHECGMELNKLKNAVYKHIVDEPKSDQFAKSAEQYAAILEKYENHQNIDFQLMQCQTREYHKYYGVNWRFKVAVGLKSTVGYWHYVFFSFLSIAGLITVYCKYGT